MADHKSDARDGRFATRETHGALGGGYQRVATVMIGQRVGLSRGDCRA
jgi:hypothetical protein